MNLSRQALSLPEKNRYTRFRLRCQPIGCILADNHTAGPSLRNRLTGCLSSVDTSLVLNDIEARVKSQEQCAQAVEYGPPHL